MGYFYEEQVTCIAFFHFNFHAFAGLLYNTTPAIRYRYGFTDVPRMHVSCVEVVSFCVCVPLYLTYLSVRTFDLRFEMTQSVWSCLSARKTCAACSGT